MKNEKVKTDEKGGPETEDREEGKGKGGEKPTGMRKNEQVKTEGRTKGGQ